MTNNTPDYNDNLYFEEKKMSDLTEQWKKGELNRNKIYYYETPFNTVDTASGYWLCNHCDTEKDKIEILGEAPSYEKWQLMQDDNKRLKHDVGNLGYKIKNQRKEIERQIAQNAQLKELLKECKQWFDWYHIDTGTGKEYVESWHKKGHEIHQKINQALGEDKYE